MYLLSRKANVMSIHAPTDNLIPDQRSVLLDALSKGITGPQARILLSLITEVGPRGRVTISQDSIGLASAVSHPADALKALSPWVTVAKKGDWVSLTPATYEVKPLVSPGTYKDLAYTRGHERFMAHDAFRPGSPLSAATPLLLRLGLSTGPWKLSDLRADLGVSEPRMRKWAADLAAAGLVTRGHGTITEVLRVSKWLPILDRVAVEAGTAGKGQKHWEDILARRARSEPKRQELLAKRKAKREEAEHRASQSADEMSEFLDEQEPTVEAPEQQPEPMDQDTIDRMREACLELELETHTRLPYEIHRFTERFPRGHGYRWQRYQVGRLHGVLERTPWVSEGYIHDWLRVVHPQLVWEGRNWTKEEAQAEWDLGRAWASETLLDPALDHPRYWEYHPYHAGLFPLEVLPSLVGASDWPEIEARIPIVPPGKECD